MSSFALILGTFSTFIEMFLSFSVISEENWFNWDSSFKKPESYHLQQSTNCPQLGLSFPFLVGLKLILQAE